MIRIVAALLLFAYGPAADTEQVRHFPSIVFGQILLGPGASRYETIFTVTARKTGLATLDLYNENGVPLQASFVAADGNVASTNSTFRFFLSAGQPVQVKVQLTPDEFYEDIALKTGWANFRSLNEIEVWALVRILKPNGTLIDKHVLQSQKPSPS
jgi:hypothetical protein